MKKFVFGLLALEVVVAAFLVIIDFYGFHNSCTPTDETILCNPTQVHYARITVSVVIILATIIYGVLVGKKSSSGSK